jgi:hypothetical protein
VYLNVFGGVHMYSQGVGRWYILPGSLRWARIAYRRPPTVLALCHSAKQTLRIGTTRPEGQDLSALLVAVELPLHRSSSQEGCVHLCSSHNLPLPGAMLRHEAAHSCFLLRTEGGQFSSVGATRRKGGLGLVCGPGPLIPPQVGLRTL